MGLTISKYYAERNGLKLIELPVYYRGKKYILDNQFNLILKLPSPCDLQFRFIKRANRAYMELYYKQNIKVKFIEEGPVIHFRLIDIKGGDQTKEKIMFLLSDTIKAIKISDGEYELDEEDTAHLYEQCEKY